MNFSNLFTWPLLLAIFVMFRCSDALEETDALSDDQSTVLSADDAGVRIWGRSAKALPSSFQLPGHMHAQPILTLTYHTITHPPTTQRPELSTTTICPDSHHNTARAHPTYILFTNQLNLTVHHMPPSTGARFHEITEFFFQTVSMEATLGVYVCIGIERKMIEIAKESFHSRKG